MQRDSSVFVAPFAVTRADSRQHFRRVGMRHRREPRHDGPFTKALEAIRFLCRVGKEFHAIRICAARTTPIWFCEIRVRRQARAEMFRSVKLRVWKMHLVHGAEGDASHFLCLQSSRSLIQQMASLQIVRVQATIATPCDSQSLSNAKCDSVVNSRNNFNVGYSQMRVWSLDRRERCGRRKTGAVSRVQ